RRVRRDRVREVSRGGARHGVEPELPGLGERDRHDPVLERVRGIARLVLDPEVLQAELSAEPRRLAKRAEAVAEVDELVATCWEQSFVAPQGPWPRLDRAVRDLGSDPLEVVGGLERTE